MSTVSAFDMQATATKLRRNCTWIVGAHVVRCLYSARTQSVTYELNDRWLVPPETVDLLLIDCPNPQLRRGQSRTS